MSRASFDSSFMQTTMAQFLASMHLVQRSLPSSLFPIPTLVRSYFGRNGTQSPYRTGDSAVSYFQNWHVTMCHDRKRMVSKMCQLWHKNVPRSLCSSCNVHPCQSLSDYMCSTSLTVLFLQCTYLSDYVYSTSIANTVVAHY